jgi:hypothetical protein
MRIAEPAHKQTDTDTDTDTDTVTDTGTGTDTGTLSHNNQHTTINTQRARTHTRDTHATHSHHRG